MVKGLNSSVEGELEWLCEFFWEVSLFIISALPVMTVCLDFRKWFPSLLSYKVQEFGSIISVPEVVNAGINEMYLNIMACKRNG